MNMGDATVGVRASSAQGVAKATKSNEGYRSHPRPEMAQFLPKGRRYPRALEIGCGEGAFSATLSSVDEVWGLEPYAPAAEVASGRLYRVLPTTFEEAKPSLPRNYFDLVICNDVIEHMTDHEAFLLSIQDHMTAGGCLIGSLPNVRYHKNLFNLLVARDWQYEDYGILDRTHFRFFTAKSLRRSLESGGFQVERLEGINGGVYGGWNAWALAYQAFACGLILASFGRARDTRHLQLGFRAVRRGP